jgi:5'-3' exonuclease
MSNITCDNLLLDGYNLIHRSRFDWGGGLANGENQIVCNFLKSIKPILERFDPKKVYFILDGVPKARIQLDDSYKANRKQENPSDEEVKYWESFHQQKRVIINFAKTKLPFVTVYHPELECDDILSHLAVKLDGENVIVSSDTDFIQTLDLSDRVKLWNPVSISFREKLDVNYAKYKAMIGDKTDNIPGVKGIGKVGATKILKNDSLFSEKMSSADFKRQFLHSYELVKFADLSQLESEFQLFNGSFSRDIIKNDFYSLNFKSMLNETYFSAFAEVMEKVGTR